MTRLHRAVPSRWLLAAIAVAALLVACGGDGTPSASPTSAPPSLAVAAQVPAPASPAPVRTTPPPAVTPRPSPSQTPVLSPPLTAAAAETTPSALADEALAFLEAFTEDHSPRESATGQELAAAEDLRGRFDEMGYRTSLQDFTVERLESEVRVSSSSPDAPESIASLPITLSYEGAAGGRLADAGLAFEQDIPAGGLDGKVALIERGSITFEMKVKRVAEAGAVAAIIFNNQTGLFRGALSTPSGIPVAAIDRAAGLDLLDAIRQGGMEATVAVSDVLIQSRNVVAEKAGEAGEGRAVIIGAHYDTVPDVEGANDNGSGIAAIMTVASRIADRDYPFTVRFILFGSEEMGLLGSRHYVDAMSEEERSDTIAMINMDVVGSGRALEAVGDEELSDMALEIGSEIGAPVSPYSSSLPEGSSSDHAPFLEVGIPAVFLMADDESRIHTPEDKLEFVNANLIGWSAEIALILLDRLAAEPGS